MHGALFKQFRLKNRNSKAGSVRMYTRVRCARTTGGTNSPRCGIESNAGGEQPTSGVPGHKLPTTLCLTGSTCEMGMPALVYKGTHQLAHGKMTNETPRAAGIQMNGITEQT